MRIDKGQISGVQFLFTIICFLKASSLLTAFIAGVALQDSWIVVLFGIALCLPLMWLYRSLMVGFPDRNLIQILEDVYGKIAGRIIGVLYTWFFFNLTALNLMDIGNFSKLTLMEETPIIVLLVLCMAVSAWAVRYGIRSVVRYSQLFAVIAYIILIVSVLLVLNQVDPQNFLPMFDLPLKKYIQGTHIAVTIPFGEMVAFLMITPNVKLPRRDRTKYLFWGFALGGLTYLIVMLRDVAVLGNTIQLFTLPTLMTLRLVNLGPSLSRMEILFAIILIMLLFFKITFLYYVSVITVAQLLRVRAYRHLVLAAGALIIAYGLTLYSNPVEHAASAQRIEPVVWTLFEILIPLLTWIVAKLRKLPQVPAEKEG